MAKLFVAASTKYLETDTAPVLDEPLSMGCWFRANDVSNVYALIDLVLSSSTDRRWRIYIHSTGDKVRFHKRGVGGTQQTINTTTSYTANTWHHACGVAAASDDRRVYLDGGGKATGTTSITTATPNRISIGRFGDSTPAAYMDGRVAEAALWNVALTDDEVAALAAGVSPLRIRPDKLQGYWPILNGSSTEPDYGQGRNSLTATGSPAAADHAPVAPPFGIVLGWQGAFTAAAGAQTITPGAVAIAVSTVAPSTAGTGAATITPGPVVVPVGLVAPSIAGSGSAPVTPGAVAIPVAVVSPSVAGSGAAPITLVVVAVPLSPVAPTVAGSGTATVSPGPTSVALAVVGPSIANVAGPQTLSPSETAIALSGVPPSVSGTGAATISPAALVILVGVVVPSIAAVAAPVFGPTAVTLALSGLNVTSLSGSGNQASPSDTGANTIAVA